MNMNNINLVNEVFKPKMIAFIVINSDCHQLKKKVRKRQLLNNVQDFYIILY